MDRSSRRGRFKFVVLKDGVQASGWQWTTGREYTIPSKMISEKGNGNYSVDVMAYKYDKDNQYSEEAKGPEKEITIPSGGGTISRVTITNVPTPVVGQPCSTAGIVLKTDPQYGAHIGFLSWYDKTENKYPEEAATFKYGHKYYLYLTLVPNEGYAFDYDNDAASSYKPFAGEVTINGEKPSQAKQVEPGSAGMLVHGKEMIPTGEPASGSIIDRAEVNGEIPVPVVGASCAVDKSKFSIVSNPADTLVLRDAFWMDVTETDTRMAETDTFEDGQTYQIWFVLERKDSGTDFKYDSTFTHYGGEAKINGEEPAFRHLSRGWLYLYGNPVKPIGSTAVTEVPSASATITAPVAGEHPDFSPVSGDSSKYDVTVDCWYADGNPTHLTAEDVFEEGVKYWVHLKFTPKQFYEFTDSTEFKVNGTETMSYATTYGRRQVSFTVTESGTVEYSIIKGMNGVYTKGSGETLAFTADGAKDDCTGIKVDGTLIGASDYSLVSGSTIVTLQNPYLETLAVGMHRIEVIYGDKAAGTNFSVEAASEGGGTTDPDNPGGGTTDPDNPGGGTTTPDNPGGSGTTVPETVVQPAKPSTGTVAQNGTPNTGDNNRMELWLVLMLATCGSVGMAGIRRKKSEGTK